MKEWILKNTKITEDQYDSLINPTTVTIVGVSKDLTKVPLTNHPIIDIEFFTIDPPTEERLKEFGIQQENNHYSYKNIKFDILAKLLPKLSSELYSKERFGRCFELNTKIGLMMKRSRIVTAICTDIYHQTKEQFLHTFIIVTSPDDFEEYVLDGTMNIIMRKKDYLDLFGAIIITDISKQDLTHAINLFTRFRIDKEISILEYLCFPHDTTNAIKKLARVKNN